MKMHAFLWNGHKAQKLSREMEIVRIHIEQSCNFVPVLS